MPDTLKESYEAVPYESNTIPNAQIGSLEAISMLHGVRPTPANRARVLELGCASGGNLIPMAYRFPNSHFIGVDFADNQVQDGIRQIGQLGLTNIELRAMSIADIDDDFGVFDYILCHGVYSWVPEDVQDAILRVSSRNLAPTGVVYMSYNAYPGWHRRDLLRQMMMFHDDPSLPASARIARARAFAERVAMPGLDRAKIYELTLADEAAEISKQTDGHLLHEQLEAFNRPVYFFEFARRAQQHCLQFLCESKLFLSGWQSEQAATALAGESDLDTVQMEQYLDFVAGTAFRMSVLCHAELPVRRVPTSEAIPEMCFMATAVADTPSPEHPAVGGHVAAFRSRIGTTMSTTSPALAAALRSLIRAGPALVSFPDLVSRVTERLAADAPPGLVAVAPEGPAFEAELADALLSCARGALVEVDRHPPVIETRVSARPNASPIARARARDGQTIPTLLHGRIAMGPPERFLLARLDGSRTLPDAQTELEAALARGEVTWENAPSTGEAMTTAIESIVKAFATCALLEA